MTKDKAVKDLMIDVFEFPHIPYWFSIRQAIGIIKKSVLRGEKCHHPIALLVFDEKYNLLGSAGLDNILKVLEPKLLKSAQGLSDDDPKLSSYLSSLFDKDSKQAADRPVGDTIVPAKVFLKPDDTVTKAAYLMIQNNLRLLPVLEDKKKLIGVVRMIEVFEEISGAVLAE
jgi:CBS domain-containing protein